MFGWAREVVQLIRGFSSRGPRFNSQHPYSSPPVTPAPRDQMPSLLTSVGTTHT